MADNLLKSSLTTVGAAVETKVLADVATGAAATEPVIPIGITPEEVMLHDSLTILAQTSNVPLDVQILNSIDVADIKVVSQITRIEDCAKNLPYRLMMLAINKIFQLLDAYPIGAPGSALAQLIATIAALQRQYEMIKKLIELVHQIIEHPETLIMALLNAKVLNGQSLLDKTNEILTNFPGVPGLDNMLNKLDELGICGIQDYGSGGIALSSPTKIPLGVPPSPVVGTGVIMTSRFDKTSKNNYDALMYSLGEMIRKDDIVFNQLKMEYNANGASQNLSDYTQMLTTVHDLAFAYHDDLSKTFEGSKDTVYNQKFIENYNMELSKHKWSASITADFKYKALAAGEILKNGADAIRAFYKKSSSISPGNWTPFNMSVYGNVLADDGTSLDKTTANDIATGKIPSSGQTSGAYRKVLEKGVSVASNYFKGGTTLEIVLASDKSSLGVVRVDDKGGMSNNVIDYYCGGDKSLYNKLSALSVKNSTTKPQYTIPIEIRIISGGPKGNV
jgi:hypothetical protein